MASRFDIQVKDNAIIIVNNDLQYAESDDQHIEDTISANVGSWKENPTDGVGIINYLKGVNIQQKLAKLIKLNLKSDGYDSNPIVQYDTSGKLIVSPNVIL